MANVLDFNKRKKRRELGRISGGGSITFCPGCRSFGLRYGSVHVRLDPDGLLRMRDIVDRMIARTRETGHPSEQVQIKFRESPVSLLVWPGELFALQELIGHGVDVALAGLEDGASAGWTH